MKVRAEVMLRSDCKGPNVSDTYDTATGPDHLNAWVIQTSEHHMYVKIINR
jgi:hypothetical protein